MGDIIAGIVNDIIKEHYAYLSSCERDSTQIEKSIAMLQAKASELHANTELAERYFNYKMAERERLFQSASKVLDKAISNGDPELADISLTLIKFVHKRSPFSF